MLGCPFNLGKQETFQLSCSGQAHVTNVSGCAGGSGVIPEQLLGFSLPLPQGSWSGPQAEVGAARSK